MTKLGTETREELGEGSFAFPKQRKEPLENASHVRNAISRFNQVKDVSDGERTPPGSASRPPPRGST